MKISLPKTLIGCLALCGLLVGRPSVGQSGPAAPPNLPLKLHVGGAVDKPGDWTVARLEKEFAGQIRTVPYVLKGQPGTAHCLSLLTLVEAVQPHLNPKIKHHLLSFMVVAQGRDGYTASFSLGEMLPANGQRDVWLALDENGKPLTPRNAPIQLIVPGDQEFGRWVHGVVKLTVVDGAKLKGL